jgi:hypothetical protein
MTLASFETWTAALLSRSSGPTSPDNVVDAWKEAELALSALDGCSEQDLQASLAAEPNLAFLAAGSGLQDGEVVLFHNLRLVGGNHRDPVRRAMALSGLGSTAIPVEFPMAHITDTVKFRAPAPSSIGLVKDSSVGSIFGLNPTKNSAVETTYLVPIPPPLLASLVHCTDWSLTNVFSILLDALALADDEVKDLCGGDDSRPVVETVTVDTDEEASAAAYSTEDAAAPSPGVTSPSAAPAAPTANPPSRSRTPLPIKPSAVGRKILAWSWAALAQHYASSGHSPPVAWQVIAPWRPVPSATASLTTRAVCVQMADSLHRLLLTKLPSSPPGDVTRPTGLQQQHAPAQPSQLTESLQAINDNMAAQTRDILRKHEREEAKDAMKNIRAAQFAALSAVTMEATGAITNDLRIILASKSTHQIQGYVQAKLANAGRHVRLPSAAAIGLLRGNFAWDNETIPGNLSIFNTPGPAFDAAEAAMTKEANAIFLQAEIGKGLDSATCTAIAASKLTIPLSPSQFMEQFSNYTALILMLFGDGLFYAKLHQLEYWCQRNSYMLKKNVVSNPRFIPYLTFYLDHCIHQLFSTGACATHPTDICWELIDFRSLMADVIRGSFFCGNIPEGFKTLVSAALPSNSSSKKSAKPRSDGPPESAPKKPKTGSPGRADKKGDVVTNSKQPSDWKAADNEHFYNLFVKTDQRAPVDSSKGNSPICLNWHVKGSCKSTCPKVASHYEIKPGPLFDNVTKFVKACRAHPAT